jgi:hypothetical protein
MDAAYILEFLMHDDHPGTGKYGICNTVEVVQSVLGNLNKEQCGDATRAARDRWEQIDERTRRQGVLSSFVASVLLREKLAGTLKKQKDKVAMPRQWMLKDFFDFDVDDCLHQCYPMVGFQTSNSDSQCFGGDRDQHHSKDWPTDLLAGCLEDALSRSGVATYAVTPDRAVQRLQLLEKEALVMESAYGGASFGGRDVAETSALEREPVAFGIGDWGTIDPGQNDTKFAWVILPRRRPLSGGRFEQAADHVNVGAIVSAPSWWKSADLSVASCWLNPRDLVKESDPYKLCQDRSVGQSDVKDVKYKFEVALPGNAAEIMTKLRFDVLTFPYLSGQRQYQNVLEVGREGALVILGGRLWRSPRVIMGNQIADRIEVLPDMDGIVAHFDCIHPYPGTPGVAWRDETSSSGSGADKAGSPSDGKLKEQANGVAESRSNETSQSAPLRAVVWTSEGRTSYLNVELKPYRQRAGEKVEDPCWLHEEQDKRSVESSGSSSPSGQPSAQDAL